jgi:hypothetical protein
MHLRSRCSLFVLLGLPLGTTAWAGVTGSISGLVNDPTSAAIVGARVTATNSHDPITPRNYSSTLSAAEMDDLASHLAT